MDTGSTAPAPAAPLRRPQAEASVRYPPDTSRCTEELLSIVAYLTARDGPLQTEPGSLTGASAAHAPLLSKAAERLDVIDAYMRARVAFLTAGREHGYHAPEAELELAGATLDAGRAATSVVEALLAARLPSRHEFDAMSLTALRLIPSLETLRETESAGAT